MATGIAFTQKQANQYQTSAERPTTDTHEILCNIIPNPPAYADQVPRLILRCLPPCALRVCVCVVTALACKLIVQESLRPRRNNRDLHTRTQRQVCQANAFRATSATKMMRPPIFRADGGWQVA
jgi:hypothetical protein